MNIKGSLKRAWERTVEFFTPTPALNYMSCGQVAFVQQAVRDNTEGFDVACFDTRAINTRRDVGLEVPKGASEDDVSAAAKIFLDAAKEWDARWDKTEVILYEAEKSPGMPSRFKIVGPTPYRILKP